MLKSVAGLKYSSTPYATPLLGCFFELSVIQFDPRNDDISYQRMGFVVFGEEVEDSFLVWTSNKANL